MKIEVDGAPGTIRTCDTRIRNPVLYPLSYGGTKAPLGYHKNGFHVK